jgi:hypothetical protein
VNCLQVRELNELILLAAATMCHHDCHGRRGQQSSSYGNGAPTYNYDPLQQAPAPYGQQMAPAYGQPYGAQGGYGPQVMPYQQGSGYGGYPGQDLQSLQAEEHRHRQNEHLAEVGALGAAAFAAVSSITLYLHLVKVLEIPTSFM